MAKRLKQQIIKIKNYGNDWLNRLAVVADTFGKNGATRARDCISLAYFSLSERVTSGVSIDAEKIR